MKIKSVLVFFLMIFAVSAPQLAKAQSLKYAPLPYPEVSSDTWVLIEIWPEVSDITLSAYFMDFSNEKNHNLCNALKRSLDRYALIMAEKQNRKNTSTRQCFSLEEAMLLGYVKEKHKAP